MGKFSGPDLHFGHCTCDYFPFMIPFNSDSTDDSLDRGSGLTILFNRDTHPAVIAVVIGIVGVGLGFTFQPTLIAFQAHCTKSQRAVVISNRNFFRCMGGACGLAVSAGKPPERQALDPKTMIPPTIANPNPYSPSASDITVTPSAGLPLPDAFNLRHPGAVECFRGRLDRDPRSIFPSIQGSVYSSGTPDRCMLIGMYIN